MKRFLNAKARITLGLVGIVVSLTLLAFFLNIIPDMHAADLERRTALAETIAVYSTALVKTANIKRLEDDFELLRERNEDLLSLALRHDRGSLLVATSEHEGQWEKMTGGYSMEAQVRVPIWSGKQQWGQLELRFSPLTGEGIWDLLNRPMIKMILFMGGICFLVYYFYLGRVLRQLDPSQAVPSRVRSALDTMAEGLLILDRKEQIVLANQAFSIMVDKPAEKLVGYRAGELPWVDTEGQGLESYRRPWVEALKNGEMRKDRTVRLQLPDDSFRTFKTNCSPVLGSNGKYAGVLISFDDITELEQKEIELLNSKLEAEEANKAKSSFLANMSHEIRTPMNAILGFTDILKRGYVKNEQDSLKYLNTIHSSGKNLLELINDILDLSKVESGRLEVETMKVQPYAIIHEVVQMLRVKANEKGIGLEFTVSTELPEEIETDPVRLRQIAFNLIGNSIKFTETGGVTVSCRLNRDSDEPKLILDIKDTGIGMTEEAQQRIFDPFTQADNSVSRRFGGTGLGLAISQRFAQALGGDVWVQSELGKGSTFSFSLTTGALDKVKFLQPQEINQRQQELETAAEVRWQFKPAKVLVVDDGQENRELIKLLLEEAGLKVDEAENGQLGVAKALANSYDLILMDVNMPVMDGTEATGVLRTKGVTIPIVALTANAMKGDEDKCLAAGYSNYFSKPIDIDRFMELMAKLLVGKKVERELISSDLAAKAEVHHEDELGTQAADTSPIHSKLPTNIEKFRNIVARFADRLDYMLDEMDEAASCRNYKTLASLAHTLKGSGGTVGFDVLTDPAAELESYAKEEDHEGVVRMLELLRGLTARIVIPGRPETSSPVEHVMQMPQPAVTMSASGSTEPAVQQPIVSRLADNPRMQPIIRNFMETLESKLVRMEEALRGQDFAELAALAHWLRGAGGTVGFDVFTTPAEVLENFAKGRQNQQAEKMFKNINRLAQALVPPTDVDDTVEKKQKTG